MIDPRTPVIVGAAQTNERDVDCEPIGAMAEVVGAALVRTGARDALERKLGAVRVIQGMWSYRDPGRLVAEECAFGAVQSTLSPVGGNEVYDLASVTASDIQAGRLDVAVLCSSEVLRTTRRLRATGARLARRAEADAATPDHVYGNSEQPFDPEQIAVGAIVPVNFYAMAESAIRHACGEGVEGHRKRIADLWARASEVAAQNPFAVSRSRVSGDHVGTSAPANRMVAAPYTKLMTANLDVDMAAAVVMCSYETARAAGIAADDLVFLTAGTGATDTWEITKRWAMHESPGMRSAAEHALTVAGCGADDFDDIDVYSCFPSAVQLAQKYLGMDDDRPYTITGGLTFGGGPFNSYCMHALATACDRIRDGRSSRTLLSGNGGYFTKHSFAVLAREASAAGFRYERPQAEVDAGPHRSPPAASPNVAELESYTVTYDRDGRPESAIVSALDADGCRHFATSSDAAVIDACVHTDQVGATVRFSGEPGERAEVVEIT